MAFFFSPPSPQECFAREGMAARESGGTAAARCAGRIGVVASVAVNLALLAMYIRRRYFGWGRSSDREIVPSKGKPPVTPDSVVNLDQ